MAEEQKIEVDMPAFDQKFLDFRELSKGGPNLRTSKDMTLKANECDKLINAMSLKITDDSMKYDWESKGEGSERKAKILAIYDGQAFITSCNSSSDVVGLVFDQSPLYAEQGGQTFDKAAVTSSSGVEFAVNDAQKYAGYVLHVGVVGSAGDLKVGDGVTVRVDFERRALIAKNHTATHILNYALRQVLGEKVDQKGSLCDAEKLRFDFAHNKPIEGDELKRIEDICNQQIQKAHTVHFREVALDKAKAITGMRAVFGETYPDPVRVVSVGPKIDDLLSDKSTSWGSQSSIEFCGGTHVANASEIYKFVLLAEEGVAKGIRRIVAVTGAQAAVEAVLRAKSFSSDLEAAVGYRPGAQMDRFIGELRTSVGQDKEVSLLMKREMLGQLDALKEVSIKAGKEQTKEFERKAKEAGEQLGKEAASSSGKTFVGVVDAGAGCDDAKMLGLAIELVAKAATEKAILLLSNAGGKCAILALVPKAASGLSAKEWTGKVLDAIGGKGGGKDDRAMGQVQDPSKLDEALKIAKAYP
ncbi:unnamed protein product [Polarella glacialis]|uniref:Alanine--tRNA ligase n=1 Tax=Polarella glacialis TaxID=89957 RepID=A0A813DA33_POLGL|nr:unnamed protein product [Polarella glacialis]